MSSDGKCAGGGRVAQSDFSLSHVDAGIPPLQALEESNDGQEASEHQNFTAGKGRTAGSETRALADQHTVGQQQNMVSLSDLGPCEEEEVVYERMRSQPRRLHSFKCNMYPLRFFLYKSPSEPRGLSRVRVLWDNPAPESKRGTPPQPVVKDGILTHSCRHCQQATPMQLDGCEKYASLYEFSANPFMFPSPMNSMNMNSEDLVNIASNVTRDLNLGETATEVSVPPVQQSAWNETGASITEAAAATSGAAEYALFAGCTSLGPSDVIMDEIDCMNGQNGGEVPLSSVRGIHCTPLTEWGAVYQPQIVMT